MSLDGFSLAAATFETPRGPQNLDLATGSTYQVPSMYNVEIPTGSAERTFAKGGTSVTVIDPNGEGTCKPRLVATASLSVLIINDTDAAPVDPFTSAAATTLDITSLANFLGEVLADGGVPSAG